MNAQTLSGLIYPIFAIFTGSEQSFQKSLQHKSSSITGRGKQNQQDLLLKKMLLKLQQYFCWFWHIRKGTNEVGNDMSVRQYLFFYYVCFTLLVFETATVIFIFFPLLGIYFFTKKITHSVSTWKSAYKPSTKFLSWRHEKKKSLVICTDNLSTCPNGQTLLTNTLTRTLILFLKMI